MGKKIHILCVCTKCGSKSKEEIGEQWVDGQEVAPVEAPHPNPFVKRQRER